MLLSIALRAVKFGQVLEMPARLVKSLLVSTNDFKLVFGDPPWHEVMSNKHGATNQHDATRIPLKHKNAHHAPLLVRSACSWDETAYKFRKEPFRRMKDAPPLLGMATSTCGARAVCGTQHGGGDGGRTQRVRQQTQQTTESKRQCKTSKTKQKEKEKESPCSTAPAPT